MDPLGDMSRGLLDVLESIDRSLMSILKNPEDMFGNSDLSMLFLAFLWPFSTLLVISALIGVLFMIGVYFKGARENLMQTLIAVVVMTGPVALFWSFNISFLTDVTQPMTVTMLDFGTEYLPAGKTVSIYPEMGHGGLQIFGYLFYLILLFVPFALAVAISLGQAFAPGLIALAFGLYAFGSVGRRFLTWSAVFWATCYIAGPPLIALSYKLLQIINMSIANSWASFLIQLIVVIVLSILLYKGFTTVQEKTVRMVGNTTSTINGVVRSHIGNKPKVDASGAALATPKQMRNRADTGSSSSRSRSDSANTRPSRVARSAANVRSGVKAGALLLSRQPVAAAKHLAKARAEAPRRSAPAQEPKRSQSGKLIVSRPPQNQRPRKVARPRSEITTTSPS